MRRVIVRCVALLAVGALLVVGNTAYASDPVHWTYEGAEGPEHWGELSPDFALCSTGKEQSPLDIPASAKLNPNTLGYAYQASAVNIFNNGHTIQVNYDPGSQLTLEDSTYNLAQFHFHAQSENTKAGQAAPMEMHLVHKNAEGKLAVVGVWLQEGTEDPAFAAVFDHLPATKGDPQAVPGATVNADKLLPADRAFYRYNGSLTTPPCTEGVKWVMLNQPVSISAAHIKAFTDLVANNARPTQPLNSRTFLDASQNAAPLPSAGRTSETAVGLWIVLAVGVVLMGFVLKRRASA